jgi:O-antigen/teichoic acid export membrane protein
MFAWGYLTLDLSFYIYALTSTLAAGYMLWTYRHRTRVRTGRIWSDLRKNWGIGKWIVVNTFGFMAANQAYPWMLLYFNDATSVAAFGVCLAVAGLLTPLLRGAAAYILPRMAHAAKDGDRAHLGRMLRLSMLVLAVPYGVWFLLGSLFGDRLVTVFYSEVYSGYGLLVILLLGKTFIESVSTPLTNALQALERTDVIAASLGAGAVVTLGMGSIMIVYMGVTGAGYAAVASSAVMAAWKWHGIIKILHAQGKTGR